MGRLSREQWEQARAEYEVRGASLGEISKKFGASKTAVRKKVLSEGWEQGKSLHLVDRKVAVIKEKIAIERESSRLPETLRHTVETVVQERLQAEGILASLDVAIASKAIEMANKAKSADTLETLSRTRKNLAPQLPREANSTTVNISQQQAQEQIHTPVEALAEIVAAAREQLDEG